MQLTKTISKLKQTSDYPGILKAELEHEIKSSTGKVEYLGPKIDQYQWQQMLNFFRWVNSTMRSEAQVRFFVNPTEGKTLFWAFPQKARTGMSAQEIDCKEHDKKLGEIQAAGYTAFGTMHSHCDAGAFQSSVDERDEENQPGIHITVGKVGQDKMDIDSRFYLNGYKFIPDLSAFWDIGDNSRDIVPSELWNNVARHQMSKFAEVPIPDEWKTNVIEIKTTYTSPSIPVGGTFSAGRGYGFRTLMERAEDAIAELATTHANMLDLEADEIITYVQELDKEPYKTIIRVLDRNNLITEMDVVMTECRFVLSKGAVKGGKTFDQIDEEALAQEAIEEARAEGVKEKKDIGQLTSQELTDLEREAWSGYGE